MSRETFEEGAESRLDIIENELMNLAINRFQWENLPLGLTSEKIEEMFIKKGQLMFFKEKNKGYFILPCMGETGFNVYGLPTDYRINNLNGEQFSSVSMKIGEEEGVLMKNNPIGTNDIDNLKFFAKIIDDIEMTQVVNLVQQTVPKIILSDDNSKLTVKNIFNSILKFKFFIHAKSSIKTTLSTTEILDNSSPYLLDKLQIYKTDRKNEILMGLGIETNSNMKKERMLVDEVNSNNEFTSINIDLMYDVRKKACDLINEKFTDYVKQYGKITVKKREVEENEKDHNSRGDSGKSSKDI